MNEVLLIIASFFICFILFIIFIPFSRILNLIDKPDNKLKRHKKNTPLIGGIVLIIVFTLLFLFQKIIFKQIYINNTLFIGFVIIGILGIIDDYKRLSPFPKIIVQSIIAVYFMFNGYLIQIEILPVFINYFITFFWILGIMNAFNLMDIMDALAGSIGIIITLTLLFINLSVGNYINTIILSLLTGYFIAFLLFNKPEAKIYLGDSGALCIGLLLSVLSIETKYTSVNNIAYITPILIFAIPIFDTFFVSIVRIIKKQNPLHGSADHFALKLNTIIIKKGFTVFVIALLQMLMSLFAYLSTQVNMFWAFAIYAFSFILLFEIAFYVYTLNYEKR